MNVVGCIIGQVIRPAYGSLETGTIGTLAACSAMQRFVPSPPRLTIQPTPDLTIILVAKAVSSSIPNAGISKISTGIVLFDDDLFYSNGPIWNHLSSAHIFNCAIAILMTLVIIAVILIKPRNKTFKFISIESVILTSCYLIATIYTFQNP